MKKIIKKIASLLVVCGLLASIAVTSVSAAASDTWLVGIYKGQPGNSTSYHDQTEITANGLNRISVSCSSFTGTQYAPNVNFYSYYLKTVNGVQVLTMVIPRDSSGTIFTTATAARTIYLTSPVNYGQTIYSWFILNNPNGSSETMSATGVFKTIAAN